LLIAQGGRTVQCCGLALCPEHRSAKEEQEAGFGCVKAGGTTLFHGQWMVA
jgi:hypothetical protein